MSHLLQPQIVILKEGTEDNSGRGQIISNINACQAVVDVIKTTLGKSLIPTYDFSATELSRILALESKNQIQTLLTLLRFFS